MADNPITTPLPADLPTDWVYGQTIGPQGTDVGLAKQYGYNYLMQQVNAAQQAATQIGQAFSGLPSLGSNGKIPASQLPAMNYDPAGSAAIVQTNLDTHINNKNNPHVVTAAQVGADPAGTAAAVQQALSSPIAALTTQVNGKCSVQMGSYTGTGEETTTIELPVTPKVLILSGEGVSSLAIMGPGQYYSVYASSGTGADVTVSNFGQTVQLTSKTASTSYNFEGRTYFWAAIY